MDAKVYNTRIDAWMPFVLALPVVGSGAALIAGVATGQAMTIAIGGLALGAYALVIFGLVWPCRYTISGDGLGIRAGLQRITIPWDRLLKVEPSSNPMSGPALSMKLLNVEYRKSNGRETFVLNSPPDRDAFLADLVAASPRHRLDGGVVRPKSE